MKTQEEISALAHRIATHEVAYDLYDWSGWTDEEQNRAILLACYEVRFGRKRDNRKAMRLLKTWLTEEQRSDLRRLGWFYVTGSAGGRYRLRPHCAHVEKVEKHGKHWFGKVRYCFHDVEEILPPADVTLAHMLHLVTDEDDFLARANPTLQCQEIWNPEWRRRLRQAREARESAA
jgi:hypothetical protein